MVRVSAALSSLLSVDLVKIGLESLDKEEAFEELVDLLVRAGKVPDRVKALHALQLREEQQSTGIGNGVAVPHGKEASIPALCCALGISRDGVEFDALDGEPADVIFLALANANNPGPHVALLAAISRVLAHPGFLRRLRGASTAAEALAVIRATEEEDEED